VRTLLQALTSLALLALIGGSAACGGGGTGGSDEAAATPSADLHLTARGLKFDHKTLVAIANTQISVTLDNKDGIDHNFAVYTDKSGKDIIFRGDVFSDRKAKTYTFKAPGPGTYFFRCDVHPDMNGTFVVE
jgi:plastocyanin